MMGRSILCCRLKRWIARDCSRKLTNQSSSFFTECKLQAVSSEASLTCTSFMNEKYNIIVVCKKAVSNKVQYGRCSQLPQVFFSRNSLVSISLKISQWNLIKIVLLLALTEDFISWQGAKNSIQIVLNIFCSHFVLNINVFKFICGDSSK